MRSIQFAALIAATLIAAPAFSRESTLLAPPVAFGVVGGQQSVSGKIQQTTGGNVGVNLGDIGMSGGVNANAQTNDSANAGNADADSKKPHDRVKPPSRTNDGKHTDKGTKSGAADGQSADANAKAKGQEHE